MVMNIVKGSLLGLLVVGLGSLVTSCGAAFSPGENVGPGKAGLLMDLYGAKRGVANAVLYEGGKVIVGPGQDLLVYPTNFYTARFTAATNEGDPVDQRVRFSASGGSPVGIDMSVDFSWSIEQVPDKPKGFTKLHQFVSKYNVEPDAFIRNILYAASRDCATKAAAEKKQEAPNILSNVQPTLDGTKDCLQGKFPELVIYSVGSLGPVEVAEGIRTSLNDQFTAQQAAVTDGEATLAEATAIANATIEKAKGEAEANRLRAASLSDNLLKLKEIEARNREIDKWNGVKPSTNIYTTHPMPNSQQ
jgi:hypothetical protein